MHNVHTHICTQVQGNIHDILYMMYLRGSSTTGKSVITLPFYCLYVCPSLYCQWLVGWCILLRRHRRQHHHTFGSVQVCQDSKLYVQGSHFWSLPVRSPSGSYSGLTVLYSISEQETPVVCFCAIQCQVAHLREGDWNIYTKLKDSPRTLMHLKKKTPLGSNHVQMLLFPVSSLPFSTFLFPTSNYV